MKNLKLLQKLTISSPSVKKKCVVIGTTGLCISIIEQLIKRKWKVLAVVSNDPAVKKFCENNEICLFSNLNEFSFQEFVLFSVINYSIIPDSFVKKQKVILAINYHDSLLPKYAGLNSVTWAIQNGEKEHGVSWHLIVPGIDEGPILEQATISIASNETALSLNLKCSIESDRLFARVLDALEKPELCVIEQDVSKKTYYGKKHLPRNYGLVDYDDPYEETERLCRALTFGDKRTNPVASIKIWDGKAFYILEDVSFKSDANSIPGHVYFASKTTLKIGVSGGTLSANRLKTISGEPVYIEATQFSAGSLIPSYQFDADEVALFSEMKKAESKLSTLLKHESFQKTFFSDSFLDNQKGGYSKALPFSKLNREEVLVFITLVLLKFNCNDLQIPIYTSFASDSIFLKELVCQNSHISLDRTLLKTPYKNFVKHIRQAYAAKKYVPKDIFYRYNLTPPLSDVAFFVSSDAMNRESFSHRLSIIIENDQIKIHGSKKDKIILDSLCNSLEYAINEMCIDKEVNIQDISVVPPKDYKNLIIGGKKVNSDQGIYRNPTELFEAQAKKNPDATAIIFKEESLSYGVLNKKANQLHQKIKEAGIVQGSLIGIAVERSFDLVVAILAILKAGCGYLPLDVRHPKNRIQNILEDSQARALISKEKFSDLFTKFHGKQLFLESEQGSDYSKEFGDNSRNSNQDDLAYVLYTSGSTGKPKGVEISIRALSSLLNAIQEHLNISSVDRCLASTTISFDIAQSEILLPLIQGASVILADEDAILDPLALSDFIEKQKVTYAQGTPSTWQMLVDAGWKGCSDLKILSIGEVLPLRLSRQLLERAEVVWNSYGPTEATIFSTIKKLSIDDEKITIGNPLSNTECYILDKNLAITPIGVCGELYIGGCGLANGYRNRPDLTHQQFISSPDYMQPKILYKTGDYACHLPNGEIEYMGRVDNQFKIRGQRVELGEIEATIESFSDVHRAAAIVRTDEDRGGYIVAYYTGSKAEEDLESALRKYLPHYMIPSRCIKLAQFPLTFSGKIDRKALSKHDLSIEREHYVAPRNQIEKRVINYFQGFLKSKKISIDANFFSLGGHSLLAFRAISGLNQLFNIQLPMRLLFEYPVMIDLATQVAKHLQSSKTLTKIPRAPSALSYPLSYAQQQFLFLSQQQPNSALYSIPFVLKITGELDILSLRTALMAIVRRHEILRTVMQNDGDEACQIIRPEEDVTFEYEDCSKAKQPNEYCKRVIQKAANVPFNLSQSPPVRFKLFQQNATEYHLLLNFSHTVFDGFSIAPLLKELKVFYESHTHAKDHNLKELNIQYKDYAIWQQQTLQEDALSGSAQLWLQELSETPTLLNLPTDWPRPVLQSYCGATVDFSIGDQNTIEKLDAIAKDHAVTPFMVLFSLFHVLLYKYTGQSDLVIGVPTSGRVVDSLNPLIGCFTNTLPVRTRSDSKESFIGLLHRIKHQVNETFQNEHIPFARILEALKLERVSGQTPLYQVMFNMLPRVEVNEIANLKVDLKNIERAYAHLDLSLLIQETSTGYSGTFEYSTDLFREEKILQMCAHFQRLVNVLVNNPETKICEAEMLSEEEIQQRLVDWNRQPIVYSKEKSILTEIEIWAKNTPNAVALVCGSTVYTYEQMNALANRVAHNLLRAGIIPESRVAVCMDRSAKFIPAILGILKAGGAFAPIDPKAPEDRRNSVLKELDPTLILTDSVSEKLFPDFRTCCVDKLEKTSVDNPDLPLSPNRLAYIIFTSGSTGVPKGVEIEYNSINDRVLWKAAAYPQESSDVMLHAYSFIFDGAIINYLWPLCSGASIVVASREELIDSSAIVQSILKWGVTTVDMLPSLLEGLVEEDNFHICTSLKNVFSGGEALSMNLVRAFRKKCSAKLHNTYGPTEATVEASAWECREDFNGNIAPLGGPIADTTLYVLDRDQNLSPVGVPGELYIGGVGLARSYLNDPNLTLEKFIPSPFAKMSGAKLYRTGDLVKYHPDGTILFLGRVDKQVKIHGFRIDLGEIESTLRSMEEVESVIVTAKGDCLRKELVAYLILKKTAKTAHFARIMKSFLEKKLPAYMIPKSIKVLDTFPTLLNGKVDYKSLPEPDYSHKKDSTYSKLKDPNPIELELLRVWKEVLNYQSISITDNFFEIGGTSLLAMRLIAKIKQKIKISIPVAELFLNPTIQKLSGYINTQCRCQSPSLIVQMSTKGEKTPFFCVHPIGGNVLCYNHLVQNWIQDRPFYAIQAHGFEDDQKPKETIREMAREYILAMKKVQSRGPYLIGGWSFGGLIATEIAHQLTQEGEKVSRLILIDSTANIEKLQNIDVHDESTLLSELTNHFSATTARKKSNLTIKEHLAQFIDNGGKHAIKQGRAMVEKLVSLAQANYRALRSYSIPKINVKMTLIRSELNPERSNDLGWKDYVSELDIYQAPGDHWAITQKKFALPYASLLRDCLSTAD